MAERPLQAPGMRPAVHLAAYVSFLLFAFGGAYLALGSPLGGQATIGPAAATSTPTIPVVTPSAPRTPTPDPTVEPTSEAPPTTADAAARPAEGDPPYRLVPEQTQFPVGQTQSLRFRIVRADGTPAAQTDAAPTAVVVREDLARFEYLHPTRADGDVWTVPLTLPAPGPYKIFADFAPPGGDGQLVSTAAADLRAPGPYVPEAPPAPTGTAHAEVYAVAMFGSPRAGEDSELTFTVTRHGAPVSDLRPIDGGFGTLVALRAGDLTRARASPRDEVSPEARGGPEVTFRAQFRGPGTYRVFLDLQPVDGRVRTFAYTVDVPQ